MFDPKHINEYKKSGKISDKEILLDADSFNPATLPANPFNFKGLLEKGGPIETLDAKKYGKKVAIIGAGCAGLCAAYELMKAGLHPVIYEASERIGGRCYTHRFEGDNKAYAEVGAMRIPLVHETARWYMDYFQLERKTFPKPTYVPTTIYFQHEKHFVPVGEPLPKSVQMVVDEWNKLIHPFIQHIEEARNDLEELSRRWESLVKKYNDKSIFQVLKESGWSLDLIREFGSIGAGGAPFGPFYHQVSFIEPLRVVICESWSALEYIVGGMDLLPRKFWETTTDCAHWGNTSVEKLNNGKPLPGVGVIKLVGPGQIALTDVAGNTEVYESVIVSCMPRGLEMSMDVADEIFSRKVWTAIRNTYLIPGGRISIRTRTAFWKDQPELLTCTVTDEPVTHVFTFEFPDTESGVICLCYTIGITAIKFDAFDDDGKVECCLRSLRKIYGDATVDKIREQMVDKPVCWTWEEVPGYNGSFKMPLPGYVDIDLVLFAQGKFSSSNARPMYNTHMDNGVYMAGDSMAWSSGWIEGALQSAITSTLSVIKKMNSL